MKMRMLIQWCAVGLMVTPMAFAHDDYCEHESYSVEHYEYHRESWSHHHHHHHDWCEPKPYTTCEPIAYCVANITPEDSCRKVRNTWNYSSVSSIYGFRASIRTTHECTTYRYHGPDKTFTKNVTGALSDYESTGSVEYHFQRLPKEQKDIEPSLFQDADAKALEKCEEARDRFLEQYELCSEKK